MGKHISEEIKAKVKKTVLYLFHKSKEKEQFHKDHRIWKEFSK